MPEPLAIIGYAIAAFVGFLLFCGCCAIVLGKRTDEQDERFLHDLEMKAIRRKSEAPAE